MKEFVFSCVLFLFVITACKKSPTNDVLPPSTPGNKTITWSSTIKTVGSGPDVRLSFNSAQIALRDDMKNLHIVYEDGILIKHSLLTNSTQVWSSGNLPKLNSTAIISKPTIGTANGGQEIYVAWMEAIGSGAANRNLVISQSLNYGQTWSAPILIKTGNFETPLSMYVFKRSSGKSGISLVWHDSSDKKCNVISWLGDSWSNTNWTTAVKVSSGSSVSHDGTVNGYGETLYVAYEDDRSGQNEIYLSKSTNGGVSWGTEFAVSASGNALRGQDPSIAVRSDGSVCIAYQNQNKIYYTTTSGNAFTAAKMLGDGLFAHISITQSGYIAITWEFFSGTAITDDSKKSLGMAFSLDNMTTVTTPHALTGSESRLYSVQAAVTLTDQYADAFWIDVTDPSNRQLKHVAGTIQ